MARHRVEDLTGAWRTDRSRNVLGAEAHHPVRRDDVVEVADVVTVQVREKHAVEHEREHPGRRHPHAHPPSCVEQQRPSTGTHEGGRAGTVAVGERVAGSEEHDVDRWNVAVAARTTRWSGCGAGNDSGGVEDAATVSVVDGSPFPPWGQA